MPRALVTGASSGIGAAVVSRLLAGGWTVLGMGRSPPPPGCRHIEADLEDDPALVAALAGIGPVDAIVHAAGVLRVGDLGALDPADGRLMWRLHVDAAVQIVSRLAPAMPGGGRIVLVGSRAADGLAGRSQYAASKAALLGLARSWAAELAPRQITVNVVAPGATDTPMLHDPARAESPPRLPPMGRFVRPEEIAGVVAFLLSDDAISLTGQQIVVCGGASL
jgi:NAD(P)-dependent dehydrogenase (short-subunit alcohol dehydrogenase family)